MKKHFIFLFLLNSLIITKSFSQAWIQGQIKDSKTKESIESVYVQNQNKTENSALSDTNGIFSIKAALSDTLVLYRVGYESKIIVCTDSAWIDIEMKPMEYLLKEVTISYEEADKIVQIAFVNLKTKYMKDMTYLWHGTNKSIQNESVKQESYALFSSTLKKNPLKENEFIDLRLIQLNHVINNVQESFILKHHKWGVEIIPRFKMSKKNDVDYQFIRQNSENDSLILISCVPKTGTNKNLPNLVDIIINKSDTVLLYFKSSLTESETKNQEYNKWGILGSKHKIISETGSLFVKTKDNRYYFDNFYFKVAASLIIFKTEEVLEFEGITIALPDLKANDEKNGTKLTGFSIQLFKLKATTTDNFWKTSIK